VNGSFALSTKKWYQFHQYFTPAFLTIFWCQNYKAETFGFETFWQKDIGKKCAHKMLMKLTPGG